MKIDFVKRIASHLDLGTPISEVTSVSGGYMHKMYCLETDKGKYAVKLLNPIIMTRSDVFDNYALAERLEKKLEENGVPIVSALTFHNTKMQELDGQFYYVFDWIDGKTLQQEEITAYHCEKIGALLSTIHQIEQIEMSEPATELVIDWEYYLKLAEPQQSAIAPLLADHLEVLERSKNLRNQYVANLPRIDTVSNGDMDPKNVMWVDNEPYVIDLECLAYRNPYIELFQLALCWTGYEQCAIDYSLMEAFVGSYVTVMGKIPVDFDTIFYTNSGRLEWLEYNIKRALWIECENEEENRLGIDQVKETMEHVLYYDAIKDELEKRIGHFFQAS